MTKDALHSNILKLSEFIKSPMTWLSSGFSIVISSAYGLVMSEILQFVIIISVVFFDAIIGGWLANRRKKFRIKAWGKWIITTCILWVLLFIILLIEITYPYMTWLSEAIITPIILVYVVSALENIETLGYLPKGIVSNIIKKINTHKSTPEHENEEEFID